MDVVTTAGQYVIDGIIDGLNAWNQLPSLEYKGWNAQMKCRKKYMEKVCCKPDSSLA